MSNGNAQCPECELIIISYDDIPAEADGVIHSCDALEALYGTDYVKSKVLAHPELHTEVMAALKEVFRREKQNHEELKRIVRLVAS
jgi:hypothetical protein